MDYIESFLLNKLESGCKILSIDGRCASGKSTLAARLKQAGGYSIVCVDHFFLLPHMRTADRAQEAGGNVDYDRFAYEVIRPILAGADFSYRPYNCQTNEFGKPVDIALSPGIIIEGAYSCHPKFGKYYDFSVFLDVSKDEQLRRLNERNPKALQMFQDKWIPLEEEYFAHFGIKDGCGHYYQND